MARKTPDGLRVELKRRFAERAEQPQKLVPPQPPPRYDDVFFEGVRALNADGREEEMIEYSYCESYTGTGRWHIRQLTASGKKLGGNIDTDSLCGGLKAASGWDISAKLIRGDYDRDACAKCVEILEKMK